MKQTKTKTQFIHVRVDPKTHKELAKYAKPLSVSEVVRGLVEVFINTQVKK